MAAENEKEEEAELKFSLALYHELHVPPRSWKAHITKMLWLLVFLLIGLFFIGDIGGGPNNVGYGNQNVIYTHAELMFRIQCFLSFLFWVCSFWYLVDSPLRIGYLLSLTRYS